MCTKCINILERTSFTPVLGEGFCLSLSIRCVKGRRERILERMFMHVSA